MWRGPPLPATSLPNDVPGTRRVIPGLAERSFAPGAPDLEASDAPSCLTFQNVVL